ncbi:MAG: histidinol-phosphate transaminase [Betaproteobacteria bacterium]|nr:histidinol-phosphate transaminase [Betaproteobacteria bacterium]MBI2961795.1 histidinol-phosphate transaminase [Betaproteobacteria bacterium]
MDICEQSPHYIRAIAPYEPGKPISELAREYGLDESRIIKLASNENPLGFSPLAKAAIERALAELPRYPDGNAFGLKAALARRYGRPAETIVIGNGSNDVLELAASAFLAPGRAAVYSQHAFAVYPLATQARGARSIVVPARDFGHDLPAMLAAITPETRVVFVANPNNPTGTFVDAATMEAFLKEVPGDVVVVVDEAYTEYLPPEKRYDCVRWLDAYRNLVVTRTFSKVYGLAGLRVGFALCDPGVADLLNRVRHPFNVNSLALAAAEAALEDREFVERSFRVNREGMAQLERGFQALGLQYIPSSANFITVRIDRADGKPQAAAVYEHLLRRGVIVRPVAGYGMPDHLRVTVGLPEENEALLAALRAVLKG